MKLKYRKTFKTTHGEYTLEEENHVFGAKGIDLTVKYTDEKFLEAWQELETILKAKGLIKQEQDDG